MVSKASFIKPTFFSLLFFLNLSLWAQSGRYVIEQRYVQSFTWLKDEYALRYEVLIERDEGEGYAFYSREFTASPGYRISLPPGNYRYRVIPYDLLDQPSEASDWVILDLRPLPVIPVEVKPGDDNSYAIFPHDSGELVPGISEIIIKAPDELEVKDGVIIVEKIEQVERVEKTEPLIIKEKRNYENYLEAAWVPVIPVYGEISQIFGPEIYFTGAALRLGIIFTNFKSIYPGLELLISWYALNSEFIYQTVRVEAGLIDLHFLLQRRYFSEKLAFTFRIGGGITLQTGEIYDEWGLYSLDGTIPHLSADASLLLFVIKRCILELGANFSFSISKYNSYLNFRPWAGLGFKY